ncbi:MAG: 4-hydroxy-3-methylbut-2-enyl diphosphate reductase [Campylobacteraceae bacterium]|jgi:4-hydroxy-3-methylbut-2-enyl diphosphate reductase|nr:4-hydroxy-3-methylbut-2-enyl diphosphate reductase [Campylobacteraceae bacterium]
MQIKLAKNYGFCFGVKRAINIAQNSPGAFTIGPLIHNNEEILRLKNNFNVDTIESIEEAYGIKKAIIRTHGIQKDDFERLKKIGVEIIDATCPFVTKPQKICEEMSAQGYTIIIFGDKTHPEVKGVKSYAMHDNVHVVLSAEELKGINLGKKAALVSQTTRNIDEFLKIVDFLVKTCAEARVFNTICNATFENQDAARELAMDADIVIVVGGKNSSNTKQLYGIAKEYCENSFLVENAEELNPSWFVGKKICGITAGASTPDWIIEKIIEKIRKIEV